MSDRARPLPVIEMVLSLVAVAGTVLPWPHRGALGAVGLDHWQGGAIATVGIVLFLVLFATQPLRPTPALRPAFSILAAAVNAVFFQSIAYSHLSWRTMLWFGPALTLLATVALGFVAALELRWRLAEIAAQKTGIGFESSD